MANDFIKINRGNTDATHAQALLQFIGTLRQAYEQGTNILAIMQHNHDGIDFSKLEGLFGIPAGDGQTIFDLVNGSVGSFNGTFQNNNSKTLTERVG